MRRAARTGPSTQDLAYAVKAKLAAIPKLKSIDEFGPLVIDAFRSVPSHVFLEIDEHQTRYELTGEGWFWMLRTVRNNYPWLKRLQAVFSDA